MLPDINPNQPIAIDLETCDPELKYTCPGYISRVGFVAGVAIAASEGSWYIPIAHAEGNNYDKEEVVAWLNKVLSGNNEKVFHNAQYDVGWLKYMGVELHGQLFDTMLAAPLLNENRFSYQLDSLGKIYCGEGKYEEALKMAVAAKFGQTRVKKTLIRLKEKSPCHGYRPFIDAKVRVTCLYDIWPQEVKDRYEVLGYGASKSGQELFLLPTKRAEDYKGLLWAVDPEEMGTYPIQDVDLTLALYKELKKELEKENLMSLMRLESEVLFPLLEMRTNGVRIDMEKAVELDKEYTRTLEELQAKVNRLAGFEVNVNIDDDLIKICNKFELEYQKTEKGNPSFTAESVPKDDLGIFETILQIRKYFKARDTYIRGYIFGSTIDGWLHGQYNQLKSDDSGTVTGRLSSSNPNMQNMPNPKSSQIGVDIRSLFLPDTDKEKWLSLDYSGQEPRMLVHTVLACNASMLRLNTNPDITEAIAGANLAKTEQFRGRGADFHTAVATICMQKEFEKEGKRTDTEEFKKAVKAFRPKAKSIGLGVMYGSGNAKVAEEMTKKGFPMTTEEAKAIRENIYEGVPFLNVINKRLMNVAKTRGYTKTILGRRGHFEMWECPVFDKALKEELCGSNMGFKTQEEAAAWFSANRNKYKDQAGNTLIGRPARAFSYKALNKYIQGSSADQTKTAMLHLYKRNALDLNALDIYYRRIKDFVPPNFKTQVHDEINFSIKSDEKAEWYQDIMEHCIPLEVEVVAEPVVCDKWSEAK